MDLALKGTCCQPPGWSRQEETDEMVVNDLTVGPDREIRGDEPLSPGQSALTSCHFPDHGSVSEARDPARPGHTLPDRSERDPSGVTVTYGARLDERAFPGRLNLRL